jgi:hypothetical protein
MDARQLVLYLEHPYSAFSAAEATPTEVLLAGLTWPTEHWAPLAVSWVEQGAPVNEEIADKLEMLSQKPFSQGLRHRSFALAARWRRGYSSSFSE